MRALLQIDEHVLEAHDVQGLFVTAGTGPGGDEFLSQGALVVGHLVEAEALADRLTARGFILQRHEVPVGPLDVVEGEHGLGLLLRLQSGHEALAGGGHAETGRLGLLAQKSRRGEAGQHERDQHPFAQHQYSSLEGPGSAVAYEEGHRAERLSGTV